MALLSTYTDANKQVDDELSVTYSRVRITGTWSWASGSLSGSYTTMWEYHRYATRTFRYVGMTLAAAQSCKTALDTLFQRTTRISVWDGTCVDGQWTRVSGGDKPMANVTVRRTDGNMWSVEVSVNEDDVCYSKVGTEAFASVFATENLRSYDLT